MSAGTQQGWVCLDNALEALRWAWAAFCCQTCQHWGTSPKMCAEEGTDMPVFGGLQWTAPGRSGASGQRAARSAPTGAAASAPPRRPATVARTAAGCCSTPKTAPTGSACRVSTGAGGQGPVAEATLGAVVLWHLATLPLAVPPGRAAVLLAPHFEILSLTRFL